MGDEVKEVAEVTEEVKERMSEEEKGCSSQRWVEEMNEKNRKKMELENKATDASTSYSQSTFWREPISQLPNLPNLPKEEKMEQPKKVEEKKPAGISLPTAEMTFDWMDDDEAVGTMDSDDSDDVPDNRENLTLDLKSPPEIPEKKKDEVPEQYSPVQYWRDPLPDILDPEEPLKNAEKSEKKSEKPKPITPKVARPKSWLASNMAGMFDRKPKPKVNAEEVVAKKKESEKKTPTASAEIKDVKPTISSSSTVTEVKSITKEVKGKKKENPTTIQTEATTTTTTTTTTTSKPTITKT